MAQDDKNVNVKRSKGEGVGPILSPEEGCRRLEKYAVLCERRRQMKERFAKALSKLRWILKLN